MNNSRRANIFLVLILLISLTLSGFVGFNIFKDARKVKAENFINKNVNEVYSWCSNLSSKYACEFIYEESRQYNKDTVFYQSVNEGEKINNSIVFKVSSGLIKSIDILDINNDTTRVDVENWIKRNNITDYTFIDQEDSVVDKGIIIRIDPKDNIYPDTPLKIYVSSGTKSSDKQTDVNTTTVKYGDYIGLSVSDFESKTKKLNLNPVHKSARDAYSSSVTKGNIVWHGSGDYVDNEDISYGISLGVNDKLIEIKADTYVGLSKDDFEKKAKELGLKAVHNEEWDNYSDTVEKGKIVYHGYGTYEPDENFRYGLSLGKKSSSSDTSEIEILRTQFRDISPEEFETKTKALGLDPYHDSGVDDYSDTIAKGKVVWHGYGVYEKNEKIRYGLSLGKKDSGSSDSGTIRVTKGQYTNISVSDFESKTKTLGLDPYHDSNVDDYSDTIEKGKVVWHGSGEYVKNEKIRYGLSLGKKDSGSSDSDSIKVSNGQFTNLSSSDFESKTKALGLTPNYDSSLDDYSDTIEKGKVVWHGYGDFEKNEKIRYGLSLGKKSSDDTTGSATIMRPQYYTSGDTYDATKEKMQKALAPFTNVKYIETTSKLGVGQIEKIVVNGSESYESGSYPVNTPIEVYIVSKQSN